MNPTLLAIAILFGAAAANEPPPIRIAYFVPSDRQPIEGYVERLDRVMTEVQRFYRDGMEAAGYGPKTFRLDRDQHGRLRVDLVRGQHPMRTYGRDASGKVRDEVKAALARQGIDVDRADPGDLPGVARAGKGTRRPRSAPTSAAETIWPGPPGCTMTSISIPGCSVPRPRAATTAAVLAGRVQLPLHRRGGPRTRPRLRPAARLPARGRAGQARTVADGRREPYLRPGAAWRGAGHVPQRRQRHAVGLQSPVCRGAEGRPNPTHLPSDGPGCHVHRMASSC